MWSSFINLVVVVGGLFVVMGLWFLIQSYVAWKSGCGAGRDPLDYLAHGCASCKGPEACSRKFPHTEHHHHEII